MLLHCKYVFIVVLACNVLFFGCKTEDVFEETITTHVEVIEVTEQRWEEELASFGTTTYKTKNDVTALVEGTISNLYVNESDSVVQGQVLAQLRNVQLEIQLEQAENSLISAESTLFLAETKLMESRLGVESRLLSLEQNVLQLEQLKLELQDAEQNVLDNKALLDIGGITEGAYTSLEIALSEKKVELAVMEKQQEISMLGLRDEDLITNGYIPSSDEATKKEQLIELNTRSIVAEIEASKASVESAKKSLLATEKLIDELTIRAPMSGVVGVKYFENGEYVPENEKIATIIDISTTLGVFSIQEQDMIHFQLGTPLYIEIPSLNQTGMHEITEISPVADPQSGNFTIKTELPNNNMVVKPGMFIRCVIQKGEAKDYPVVPETALLQKVGNNAKVFCVINGFAVLKEIQLYSVNDGKAWVIDGITLRDIVVDKPSPFLREGQHVTY